jgi:hypothetical protein
MITSYYEIDDEIMEIYTPLPMVNQQQQQRMVEFDAQEIVVIPQQKETVREDKQRSPGNYESVVGISRPYPGYGSPMIWAASNVLAFTIGRTLGSPIDRTQY